MANKGIELKIGFDSHALSGLQGWQSGEMRKQMRFAGALALTKVAQQSAKEILDDMPAVFKHVSNWTKRQIYVGKANYKDEKPHSIVAVKYKGRYLVPEVKGGPRDRKRSEAMLYKILKPYRYYVPISPKRINKGELERIISYLGANPDAASNSTAKSLERRKKSKKAVKTQYFVERKGNRALIFARGTMSKSGRGYNRLVYVAAKQPIYKKRLDFNGIIEAVMETKYDDFFKEALEYALKTAKK